MTIQFRRHPGRGFTLRFLGLMLALVLAAGFAAASHVSVAKASNDIELTYTKWFPTPGSPVMAGVVGGDIEGTFAGLLLSRTAVSPGVFHLKARYDIIADHRHKSFSAIVEGNSVSGTADLGGVVTSGRPAGGQVVVHFVTVPSCALHPSGPCFQGTIQVSRDSDDESSSDG
jgi:hypothetical protein